MGKDGERYKKIGIDAERWEKIRKDMERWASLPLTQTVSFKAVVQIAEYGKSYSSTKSK